MLDVDGSQFPLSDSTGTNDSLRSWQSAGLIWTVGTDVVLKMLAQTSSTDATLSGLVLNDGTNDLTLTPAFATGTTSYAASVGNAVSQITVTPETNDSNASVEYLDGNDAAITDADGTATGQQVALVVRRKHDQGQGHRRGRDDDRDLYGRRDRDGHHHDLAHRSRVKPRV